MSEDKIIITDAMVDAACKAFSESSCVYPDGDVKTPVTDWFNLDAEDAVEFGVIRHPKWDGYSDIRGMQHEWYVAAVVKEPMKAALFAAFNAQGPLND